jgi:TetR/AcrR family transcriptional regulator, repressor for uid operon
LDQAEAGKSDCPRGGPVRFDVASRTKRPKLGRPPASNSAETRDRIVTVARETFAELGYTVTTNKFLAAKVGITTGALYHYFDSKAAIYQAVYEDTQERIYARFESEFAGAVGFLDRFEAVLEAAYVINLEDPSLARFIGAARIDTARHDELRRMVATPVGYGQTFFQELVETGVKRGEIEPGDRDMILAFIRTVTVGLTDAVSGNPRQHRLAIDAVRASLEGRLIRKK